MQKILLSILLSSVLLFCFSQHNRDKNWPEQLKRYSAADKIYNTAHLISENSPDDEVAQAKADSIYLLALKEFNQLLPSVENTGNDSIQFFIRLKRGYTYYYLDSIELAKKDYLAAIRLKKNLPSIADSFLFIPDLFTGTIYYGQSQFDSAMYYFKKAEQIADLYPQKLSKSQRLYNMAGVMHYETGNYKQARNYFEKAILLTDARDTALAENFKINIAALLVKLESFDEAKKLYLELLPSSSFENEIYHNLAIIALKEQQYNTAIDYLRKVSYPDNKKIIDLYYNFGSAYAGLNDNDSVEFYLQKALAENLKWNGHNKNTSYGLILKYEADELAKQQLYKEAADGYQKSICQFVADYYQTDPYQNPVQFSSAFSYINLFNTLAAKASSFENWYQQEKNVKLLDAALDAYRAAFNLAGYVEKTYDSDEARLFLGKIKYNIHGKPIDISLQLYDLTQKKRYLEEAYLFDQQNKASALAFNIQEQELRIKGNKDNDLLNRESEIKSFITRLSLKAAQLTDSIEISGIVSSIRDKEIELSRIQVKLKDDPEWKEKMESERIPAVNQIQKKLDHTTALISYHLTENELLILLITQSRFEYYKSVINKNFFNAIESFKTSLHQAGGDQHYNGTLMANRLFEKLIAPVYDKLIQIKRLVIIPDDELHYLPFEALQDENKKYLLERFSVQYQYSTALLVRDSKKLKGNSTLSFAPFVTQSYMDSSGNNFTSLPFSGQEISGLPGASFIDSAATKPNFLRRIDTYRIFHLATHAKADNNNPSRSFIAFYPGDDNSKLYASEIANLQLDSTQLVILSACETGAGQLVKGEGLMSLSRAFAYAGCPDIITSLWKAEDRTTAFLTKQLHYYLEKNYTKDRALQQAKLDLLASDKIDPRFKSPVYWAHLVFIGNYESRQNPAHWWWIAFAFIAGAIIYKLLGKKKEEVDSQ